MEGNAGNVGQVEVTRVNAQDFESSSEVHLILITVSISSLDLA